MDLSEQERPRCHMDRMKAANDTCRRTAIAPRGFAILLILSTFMSTLYVRDASSAGCNIYRYKLLPENNQTGPRKQSKVVSIPKIQYFRYKSTGRFSPSVRRAQVAYTCGMGKRETKGRRSCPRLRKQVVAVPAAARRPKTNGSKKAWCRRSRSTEARAKYTRRFARSTRFARRTQWKPHHGEEGTSGVGSWRI